jgi:hypothetical protein
VRRPLCLACVLVLAVPRASAAADLQIWGHVTLTWIQSHAFTAGVDIEPKVLVAKAATDPEWRTLDVTPSVELTKGNWFDMIAETLFARTRQSDNLMTTEVTPRIGLRFHLLSNLHDALAKEKQPRRRLVLRNLIGVEWRTLSYSDGTPSSSTARVRNRLEALWAVNRPRVTDAGATYALSDAEWFWTQHEPQERFANKQRLRAGIGHRFGYAWRVESLYVWDRSRDAASDGFSTAHHAIEASVRRVW